MFKEPIEIQHNTNYTASATLKVIIVEILEVFKRLLHLRYLSFLDIHFHLLIIGT